MDTTTVLEMIAMVQYRRDFAEKCFKSPLNMDFGCREYFRGKVDACDDLIIRMEKFLEGQLNALENKTGE